MLKTILLFNNLGIIELEKLDCKNYLQVYRIDNSLKPIKYAYSKYSLNSWLKLTLSVNKKGLIS